MYIITNNGVELYHFGIPHRSGRYPYGSGERPYQDREGSSFVGNDKRNIPKGPGNDTYDAYHPKQKYPESFVPQRTNRPSSLKVRREDTKYNYKNSKKYQELDAQQKEIMEQFNYELKPLLGKKYVNVFNKLVVEDDVDFQTAINMAKGKRDSHILGLYLTGVAISSGLGLFAKYLGG